MLLTVYFNGKGAYLNVHYLYVKVYVGGRIIRYVAQMIINVTYHYSVFGYFFLALFHEIILHKHHLVTKKLYYVTYNSQRYCITNAILITSISCEFYIFAFYTLSTNDKFFALSRKESVMKKLLGIFLAICLTATALFLPTASAADIDVWDGSIAESYAGGSGSETDPYLISTPEQLAKLRNDGSTIGKYYKLSADIYLNDVSLENWTSSAKGWYSYASPNNISFSGHLDGDGHTVYGLYYNGSEAYFGLFCRVHDQSSAVSISNLTISDASITTTGDYAGALVGFEYNYTSGYTYKNCIIEDSVSITSNKYAGGLVGWSQSATTFDGCASYAAVSASSKGGFAGYFKASTKSLTINDSFAVANTFVGSGSATTATNSYESVDGSTVQGEAAETAMPDLSWDSVWFAIDEAYPKNVAFYTVPTEVPWDGTIASGYAGGSGSETDPYLIATAEQLALLVNDSSTDAKHYKLTADIYLNDVSNNNWTETARSWSDGTTQKKFQGSLDGDGHTVYGLYYNGSYAYYGLFCLVQSNKATISFKNLRIADASITTSGDYAGALAGLLYNNGFGYSIENCVIGDSVSVTAATYAGGIIAYSRKVTDVSGCASFAKISATNKGGYAGYKDGTLNIYNSFFTDYGFVGKGSADTTVNSYEKVDLSAIIGENAKTVMPDLRWNTVWVAADGIPQNAIFYSGTYTEGSGSETDPFIISNEYLLRKAIYIDHGMNSDGSKAYYKLSRDLYLNDVSAENWIENATDWRDAVTEDTEFVGAIDGDGFTVYGLYYAGSTESSDCGGLVPLAGNDAEIKNIRVDTACITSQRAGGIVGWIMDTASVENCSVSDLTATAYWTGAIIGLASNGTDIDVTNCYATDCILISTSSSSPYSPGFYGDAYGATLNFENCYIEGYYFKPVKADGGVRGGTATNCYFTLGETTVLPTSDNGCTEITDGNWSAVSGFSSDVWYQAGSKAPLLKIRGLRLMDVSGDDNSVIDTEDLCALRLCLIGNSAYENIIGDTDGNGIIDICDLVKISS